MIKTYGTVRCHKCELDLTNKIQVYTDNLVLCENCNCRIKDSYYE